jgi:hypothetical protein
MYFSQIISLLSNHRNSDRPEIPIAISKTQIISSVSSSLSPNKLPDRLSAEISEALNELEAQGEINAGSRNRYCIAPPTVLAEAKDNLTGLLFKGDHAYLPLVHKVLKTEQEKTKTHIRTSINNFNVIKNKLSQVGIVLLTVEQSIESLPLPELPTKVILRSPWSGNPFENSVLQYIPQDNFHTQSQRWQTIIKSQLSSKSLLQLATGEYLWFEDSKFYELEQDRAILTMFALDEKNLDEKTNHPLQIHWDKPEGKLNLQGISLPSAYARWLWSLSKPVEDCYRTRYIKPDNQPLVESAFNRLGCRLV